MITIAEPIDLDTLRIRHELISRPGLRVSVDAVAASLQIAPRHALLALESLVVEGFLERLPDGQYVRVSAAPSK
jgi:predicted transcriptional regulator of viral defense system